MSAATMTAVEKSTIDPMPNATIHTFVIYPRPLRQRDGGAAWPVHAACPIVAQVRVLGISGLSVLGTRFAYERLGYEPTLTQVRLDRRTRHFIHILPSGQQGDGGCFTWRPASITPRALLRSR
jgi:hypothetical protein